VLKRAEARAPADFAPAWLGLWREAQRHAAFARTKTRVEMPTPGPPENGVAAPALPPHSKTLRDCLQPQHVRGFLRALALKQKGASLLTRL